MASRTIPFVLGLGAILMGCSSAPSGTAPDAGGGDATGRLPDAALGDSSTDKGGDAAPGDDASSADGGDGAAQTCPGSGTPNPGRPVPVTCTANPALPDSGVACTTSADCTDAGQGGTWSCLGGQCQLDQCQTDSDCATGELCACRSEYFGNAIQLNRCIAVQCRVNSDCGDAGVCSGSFDQHCGSVSGYYCHSPADTCQSNSDCCGSTPLCAYQSTFGHWACQAVVVCNG